MITELERYNFLHLPLLLSGRHTLQNPPHVIFVSDLYGAAQSVIDPATEAIQIIGTFPGRSQQCDTHRFYPTGTGMYVFF